MMPGVTYFPVASTTVTPAGASTVAPTAAIFPSTISTWPLGITCPAAVITVPPRMSVGGEGEGRYVLGEGTGRFAGAGWLCAAGRAAGRACPPPHAAAAASTSAYGARFIGFGSCVGDLEIRDEMGAKLGAVNGVSQDGENTVYALLLRVPPTSLDLTRSRGDAESCGLHLRVSASPREISDAEDAGKNVSPRRTHPVPTRGRASSVCFGGRQESASVGGKISHLLRNP